MHTQWQKYGLRGKLWIKGRVGKPHKKWIGCHKGGHNAQRETAAVVGGRKKSYMDRERWRRFVNTPRRLEQLKIHIHTILFSLKN